jgi:hypothetical protein
MIEDLAGNPIAPRQASRHQTQCGEVVGIADMVEDGLDDVWKPISVDHWSLEGQPETGLRVPKLTASGMLMKVHE